MSGKGENKSIFVGKLSSRITEKELETEFSRCGRIKDIDLRKHRGFAFIEFNKSEDASEAVKEMDGRRLEGTKIVVQIRGENRRSDRSRGPQ